MEEFPHEELTYIIVYEAAKYFAECPEDFCLQSVGYNCIIFGGTNRLIWTPNGFAPDISYCTEKFLKYYSGLNYFNSNSPEE